MEEIQLEKKLKEMSVGITAMARMLDELQKKVAQCDAEKGLLIQTNKTLLASASGRQMWWCCG